MTMRHTFSMLLKCLMFLLAGACWWAVLWFGIAPDFGKWSHPATLAAHALPPLAVCLSWWFWRRHVRLNKSHEAEAREATAQAERQAALEQAHARHAQEIEWRQFACDCRLVAISDLALHAKLDMVEEDNVWIDTVAADTKAGDIAEREIFEALQPAMMQALRYVYGKCGAAAVWPVYILPPADLAGEDVVQCVRTINAALIAELALPVKPQAGLPQVLFLPSADSASDSVIGLFESAPDLPGAVVLAFDSPLSQAYMFSGPRSIERQRQIGKPGHGVFALLLTHTGLPAMLSALADQPDEEEHDSLTPFWDKALRPEGRLALLTLVPAAQREQLAQLVPVARIHRAALGEGGETPGRVLELSRTLTSLLERAQVNAGLIALPFVSGDITARPDAKENEEDASRCEWLVHNAGGADCAGSRLASIGAALMYFNIELNPVAMATNIVTRVGNLGRARSIAMLAMASLQAQAQQAPALLAEFSEPDKVALAFTVPLPAA
jgi:hypothetical protein